MDIYSSHESAHPGPDFVPSHWLAEFGSDAQRQVRTSVLQSDLKQWRPGLLWNLIGASPLVVILCMASLLWAVSIGSTLVLWLIGGLWLVSSTAAAVWVGVHLDALVDATSR